MKEEKEREGRTLREENEHDCFSFRLSLLERTCGKIDTPLFLNTNLIFFLATASGKALYCCSFPPLSNSINLG